MGVGGSKLIFSSSIEALLKVAAGRVKPHTERALAALRIGPPHKLEPAYAAADWAKAVQLVGADLFPNVEATQQHFEVGRATVMQFTDGLVGRAMLSAAKLFGARRSLQRMSNSLRRGANFLQSKLTIIDEKTMELWLNDASGVPHFYAGLLSAGHPVIPGWPDLITVKSQDGDACVLELKNSI
ncbi:MAG: DUF2378 family protein [Archangium sp.]|nr:DUF2378 family protein [Archangium sp.]